MKRDLQNFDDKPYNFVCFVSGLYGVALVVDFTLLNVVTSAVAGCVVILTLIEKLSGIEEGW